MKKKVKSILKLLYRFWYYYGIYMLYDDCMLYWGYLGCMVDVIVIYRMVYDFEWLWSLVLLKYVWNRLYCVKWKYIEEIFVLCIYLCWYLCEKEIKLKEWCILLGIW